MREYNEGLAVVGRAYNDLVHTKALWQCRSVGDVIGYVSRVLFRKTDYRK